MAAQVYSPQHTYALRSVSTEADLQPGMYELLPQIEATENYNRSDALKVVKLISRTSPDKLRQIGRNYDVAHAKVKTEYKSSPESGQVEGDGGETKAEKFRKWRSEEIEHPEESQMLERPERGAKGTREEIGRAHV